MTKKQKLERTKERILKHKELAEKMQNAALLEIDNDLEEYVNILLAEEERAEKVAEQIEKTKKIIEELKAELDKT